MRLVRSGHRDGDSDNVLGMSYLEFAQRAEAVLGGWGWRRRLARALGTAESTVARWKGGKVPGYAWAVVECLERLKEERLPFPLRFIGSDRDEN